VPDMRLLAMQEVRDGNQERCLLGLSETGRTVYVQAEEVALADWWC
jgi:hypothetical protein